RVTLDFDAMADRLFAMSFDPYHCIERRWGASGAELASCPDGADKTRWYEAEQRLRNQIDRTYDTPMNFTVAQLESRPQGSGVDHPPPVDLKALIGSVGYQEQITGMN